MGNWIKGAIKHPGALRATAKREGLVKGDQPISLSALGKMKSEASKTGNTTLAKRVNLAKTLKGMHGY